MTTKVDSSSDFDAQRMKEEAAETGQKLPEANVESDYERSKEFATAEVDRTDAGASAAQKATAPDHKLKTPEEEQIPSQAGTSDSDPNAFRAMAREINPNQ